MSTVNQTYPLTAGRSTDNYVPDVALIGSEHQSTSGAMPANTAFVKYEVAKLDAAGALVKYGAAAAMGDNVVIVCYDADNLTATPAAQRTTKAMYWYEGEFNENSLVYVGGNSAATIRGVAMPDIVLRNPQVRN
jgi:hypothetical protein